MLHYSDTTVFNVGAQTIVNTVNCVGVMGAGLALEFQLRFPEMKDDYVQRCQASQVEVGRPYLYKGYDHPWILNFPTKHHWKYPSKLEWIEQGLQYFAENYQKGGITSIAFPKLGCSHGGLDWNVVSRLMERYLLDLDLEIFICKDNEQEASGTEGLMVQMINNMEKLSWPLDFGMRSDVKAKLIAGLPIHRFRDLRDIEGIGKQTYKDLFQFLDVWVNQCENSDYDPIAQRKSLDSKRELCMDLPAAISDHTHKEIYSEGVTYSLDQTNDPLSSTTETLSDQDLIHETSSDPHDHELYDDLFYVILPSIEKALKVAQTPDQVTEGFNQFTTGTKISKKMVSDWLKLAEKLGKIKKLPGRPTKYVAASLQLVQQLECDFNT